MLLKIMIRPQRLPVIFIIINLQDGIDRFGQDLDIIGVDVYPNIIKTAYPVMGFMVGEVVRATRRVLYNKGLGNKEVHVMETSYPGIETDMTSSDGASVYECINKYSYYRQLSFMQEAMTTARDFGAKGFFWWGFLDNENSKAPDGSETNYGSLIRVNPGFLYFKPAATTFQTNVPYCHPLKADVLLKNVALSDEHDLGGKISLYGERDNLNSGTPDATVPAVRDRNHISKTEQQFFGSLKHQMWDVTTPQYKVKESFFIRGDALSFPREAKFSSTSSVTLRAKCNDNYAPVDLCDPWLVVDTNGNQPRRCF